MVGRCGVAYKNRAGRKAGNTAEVDFIYEDEGEVVPVEVKAADNTQAKSYILEKPSGCNVRDIV